VSETVVRTCALESLAAVVTCSIPELREAVCIGAPPSSHEQTYPSLTINAVKWAFRPENIDELRDTPPGVLIRRVGHHEGMVQLRVLATTTGQRDELSERISKVFEAFEDEDGWPHPGVVLTRITECGLVPWTASFELDSDEWVNLEAFERKYEALLQVDAFIPALICKIGVLMVETLALSLATSYLGAAGGDPISASATEIVRLTAAGIPVPYLT
jgi:hypothetical protein